MVDKPVNYHFKKTIMQILKITLNTKKYLSSIVGIFSLVALTTLATEKPPVSFQKAKKNLYTKIYDNSGETFYCDCTWSKKKTELKSCGLQSFFPKKERKRAARTEAEHIIPASWMLKKNKKFRQCVLDAKEQKVSPRKYCQKHDTEYKRAHNDIVNLRVTVGQINADRSNKPFVEGISKGKETYGQCRVSTNTRGFSPALEDRGDIARIAFYMMQAYGVTYSKRQLRLFEQWNMSDPITLEERRLHKRIIQVQGYGLELED